MKKNKKNIIITIIAMLIVFRIFLPEIIKHYLNDYLAHKVTGYTGHIEDFDLSLWRGAYQLEGFTFRKKDGMKNIPLISIKKADISVSWKALFRGRFLIDLEIFSPLINLIDSENENRRQFGTGSSKENAGKKDENIKDQGDNWNEVFEKIVPFNLEKMLVHSGELHFKNIDFKSPLDISLEKIELQATNINNSAKDRKTLFSKYKVSAIAQKHANFSSSGSFNLVSKPFSFDVNAKLEAFDLRTLNEFFFSYSSFNIKKGTLSAYLEVASKEEKFKGYIKPLFQNVEVMGNQKEFKGIKHFAYEAAIAVINLFFRNSQNHIAGTKIEFSGNTSDTDFDSWKIIKSAFENAFGDPTLDKKIDNDININSLDEIKSSKEKKKKIIIK